MENDTKEDFYVKTFMGTKYDFGKPRTVGQLRAKLEEIAADLPNDDSLKIAEVDFRNGALDYTLVDGVVEGIVK